MGDNITLRESYDLAVIGGGPAGLAAASSAARLGLDTVLFDEQTTPGGQTYRAVSETPVRARAVFGDEYWKGGALVAAFTASGAQHVNRATVWHVSQAHEVLLSRAEGAYRTRAREIIIATGAFERPFPIPGWTLPGVMTAGAGQIMLKSSGLLPEGRVVLAGSGPLLWLLASEYLHAGMRAFVVLETTPRANYWRALRHLPSFLTSPHARVGLRLVREVRRGVEVLDNVTALRAEGRRNLESVVYRRGSGPESKIAADLLFVHQGVVPNVNLTEAIGCRHVWDPAQSSFRPLLDEWGATTIEGVSVAGDGAGIAGALAAEHRGRVVALAAAHRLGIIDRRRRDREAVEHRTALARAERGRRFLEVLFRTPKDLRIPAEETIVCRCEEVRAGEILAAAAQGDCEPNQTKSLLRCGMGPCQGRMCGLTVCELIAQAHNVSPQDIGYYHLRPPIKPIRLSDLAFLAPTRAAEGELAP